MSRSELAYLNFNRGMISPLAAGRIDLKRTAVSAETMTNFIPRVFGSMSLRAGLKYIEGINNNEEGLLVPFINSASDTALLEITDNHLHIRVSDSLLTINSVSTTVTNGSFTGSLTGWTDADESGGTSVWVTGNYMGLTGNGSAAAIRYQQVTVSGADIGVRHNLFVTVATGAPVSIRVGTTSTDDSYINETVLHKGDYTLAFTPTGDFFIQFLNRSKRQGLVYYCNMDTSGHMYFPTPWALSDQPYLRYAQSGNTIYLCSDSTLPTKVVKYGAHSWGVINEFIDNGPFRLINTSGITISSSALSGSGVTLTASSTLFRSSHVGALFKIASIGQIVTQSVTAANVFTNTVRVTGVGSSRTLTIIRANTWVATVTLQRSTTDSSGPFSDVTTYTTNGTVTYADGLDNVTAWYRIGVKTGNYTSGTVDLTLSFPTGSIDGIVRITAYSNATSVTCEVIQELGATTATPNWYEGAWSDFRGYPSSVALHEGRLFYSGLNNVWGSVSDAYEDFGTEIEGDSGSIDKTIGYGPVDNINWIMPLQRLLLGGDSIEYVCKSSSFDEPLTPTNLMIKTTSTQGSQPVRCLIHDKNGYYVQRGGKRIFEVSLQQDSEYGSKDITLLCPEAISDYVVRMEIQRQPDTRIHCVLNDGSLALGIIDRAEEVLGWVKYTTDGYFEDVCVLPGAQGSAEDSVYYIVRRTINGATKRYVEKVALESDCTGGTLNHQLDSYYAYSGASTTTITGLSHLEAKSVAVWANGKSLGSYTVSSGQITGLSEAVTSAIVGIAYTAQWKSFKLGQALMTRKRVDHIGLLMRNVYATGLQYGHSFSNLYDLPQVENGTAISSTSVRSEYDEDLIPFSGTWDHDSRVCLQAVAPKPCTVIAMSVSLDANTKT